MGLLGATLAAALAGAAALRGATAPGPEANCYLPVEGGWEIRIMEGAPPPAAGRRLGEVLDQARLHRRPLYPPADKSLIWTPAELAKLERCGFRPLVLAYNEPRFLFDFHSAGGLLGHLRAGLVRGSAAKWFHQWSGLRVRYVDGCLQYALSDPDFPGVTVTLEALPLADAAGLVLRVAVAGLEGPAALVWAYGGASAFFTNYAMDAPEFRFAPGHCARDGVAWEAEGFVLRRAFDPSDVSVKEPFAAARCLPGWQGVIRGGSSWMGENGLGTPEAFTNSPAALWRSTGPPAGSGWTARTNCVAVQRIPLAAPGGTGWLVAGMGFNLREALRAPAAAWRVAQARQTAIAHRVVTHTPDPHLDAAVRMMALATEGTWGDLAILHGGWSWRFAYLGWRGWYGSACYGWTDRVKRSIQNHTRLGVVREGPDAGGLGALLEYSPGIYYNMNEVFLDQARQYFDYTGDLPLAREIFPTLAGILDWEDRRLQPGRESLYENSLNTWISDSHWYIQGQCTQASAYMLGANRFLADLARRLGRDPAPFEERARRIRAALQEKLWLPRAGVFAEYRDTRGQRLLHPEPELATLYHAAEFGAADPFQVYQMLRWAGTRLRSETTPGGGRLVWSSNWFPNRGRSYTHSTYELAYGEELNLALACWQAGRADDAWAILRATFCGIFNGPTPGGLACHAYADGRQRANDEFTDAISMWGRAVVEGLFGITPKRLEGSVELSPQFPRGWSEAAIEAPHFAYRWQQRDGTVTIDWRAPGETAVRFRLPLAAAKIHSVEADGQAVPFEITPGFDGLSWVQGRAPTATSGRLRLAFAPRTLPPPAGLEARPGGPLLVRIPGQPITGWHDPQGVLAQAQISAGGLAATAAGEPGPALAFALAGEPPCTTWVALPIQVLPSTPAAPPRVWRAPPAGQRDLQRWIVLDLGPAFNDSVTNVLPHLVQAAQPPPPAASQVGFGYWRDHLQQYHGSRNQEISDSAWRGKAGPDGTAWTTDGIPFRGVKTGPNIGVVSLAGGYPARLEFPARGRGQTLYLMLSGMTFPAQSHVVNLRLLLRYADGGEERVDLANPSGIGDCWGTWCGRYHDTPANGFENLGGRAGPAGSAEVADLTQPVALDTEAHLLALPLRPGADLSAVVLEAIANDCVFGLMGATILKGAAPTGGTESTGRKTPN